mmetsp:Transcript_12241/g.23136  ORF Transcript_12241/g.23136 Transcript_12241/m.23136 type:complete len:190 (+) Transcript_12241:51-620(+)
MLVCASCSCAPSHIPSVATEIDSDPPSVWPIPLRVDPEDEEGERPSESRRRRLVQQEQQQQRLNDFLRIHKFSTLDDDLNTAMPRRCFGCLPCSKPELPLHVAARLGEVELIRLLLQASADPKAKNSQGLTPLAVARKEDRGGSHQEVIQLLQTKVITATQAHCLGAQALGLGGMKVGNTPKKSVGLGV